jgi:hypothetical protein
MPTVKTTRELSAEGRNRQEMRRSFDNAPRQYPQHLEAAQSGHFHRRRGRGCERNIYHCAALHFAVVHLLGLEVFQANAPALVA